MSVKTELSEETVRIVKSTVPVLAERGEDITTCFYQQMFADYPELKNLFNQTNQKAGRQPKALANAVYAAAQHIDDLSAIMPTVMQISEKHRSLNVKPEHYPIVGEYLLLAIKEVLGDAATDDIIEAWGEAYGVIANAFIEVEKQKYKAAASQKGGWKDSREFRVWKKVKESDVITSFYLQPADGRELAAYRPGQYITIKAEIPGENHTHLRQYSLSDSPGNNYYRISVKREDENGGKPAGVVSTYLHTQVGEGDAISISAPAGDFYLDMESVNPVVLISGGVGLTPLISMMKTSTIKDQSRDIYFIHATRNGSVHAFKEDMKQMSQEFPFVKTHIIYDSPMETDCDYDKEGYIDLAWLRRVVPPEADFYYCGPEGFMKTVHRSLIEWDVPVERRNYEFFGPEGSLD
ncbi:NO-inducible flavohemoprotein [Halobacillus shinanisalinarum]|uniref:Flavohemoprotein n=1 Tax=Halobacillus shinanisalinarum TaxID=2932258 RepID=A0ABY4H5L2_9BACI|nr:NO-inducible flavohemoprotein [Halobacillus shinanisalinarum]UOQ95496.1 NO-inducible flavohemoprotein [Halobacillus shinanisalinarum]